jgi:hypothetical protein
MGIINQQTLNHYWDGAILTIYKLYNFSRDIHYTLSKKTQKRINRYDRDILGNISPQKNQKIGCAAPPGLVRDAPSLLLSLVGNPVQDPSQLWRISIGNSSHFRCLMIQFKIISEYTDTQN